MLRGERNRRGGLALKLAIACAAWFLCIPSNSRAQIFLQDRAATEGPGFRVGRLELHPGVLAEMGYDSNVFLENEDPRDSMILRAGAHFDVATVGQQRRSEGDAAQADPAKVAFRAGAAAVYYHYFFDRLRDNVAADGHFDVSYRPNRVFALNVRELFRRSIRPFTDPNVDGVEGEATQYGRNDNFATIELVGSSKSQVLQGRASYTNEIGWFESNYFDYANNMRHRVLGGFDWKFFPTSALVYELDLGFQNYMNPDLVQSSPTLLSDNTTVSNRLGFNGSVTRTLSLTALIGYAVGFYDALDDFDDVIARAEIRWKPRPTISVDGGYDRNVNPSYIGNFTVVNRLFFNTKVAIAGVALLGFRTWVSFDKSGLALTPEGTPLDANGLLRRKDIRYYAGLFGEYRVASWLAFLAEVAYTADFTDFVYSNGLGPLVDPPAQYQKGEAWVGLRIFY